MSNKLVIIFGGSRGFGQYVKNYFLDLKYNVLTASRSQINLTKKNHLHFKLNILNQKEVKNFKKYIEKKKFKPCIVFFNIGDHFEIK